ncbi:MAG: DUF4157 domain-containing protein [Nevskia sp.]|nr:DUF4157 domain-containing protein [Nevskia sp.]
MRAPLQQQSQSRQAPASARTGATAPRREPGERAALQPHATFEDAAQRERANPPEVPPAATGFRFDFSRIPATSRPSGQILPHLDAIQRSFGRHDVSAVRAHLDGGPAARARALGADAYTSGAEVTFSGAPSLHTAAHEAAHVVQQRAGVDLPGGTGREGDAYERHADAVADRVLRGQSSEALLDTCPGAGGALYTAGAQAPVQMRRIPPNVRALLVKTGGGQNVNFAADEEGAQRLIDRAMADLTPAEKANVDTARLNGLSEADFQKLPKEEQLSRHAEAIIAQFPDKTLGDPKLIDTGPRPATADAANVTKVVNNTDVVFADIASGARDIWLKDVFGAANVAAAKAKYAKGRTLMNNLHGSGGIVTDRSGYSEEVSQGGLTDPPGTASQKIRVEKSVIDSPDDHDSIVTLLHESMHAGNADVSDDIYVGATGFTSQTDVQKLKNSAHFEVVPWRILDPAKPGAYANLPLTAPPTFQAFIPAGATVGGVTAPTRTKAQEGAIAAYDLFRSAWTTGLNLHPFYVQLFKKPTDWTVPQPQFGNATFDKAIPYWSKVEKLTVHKKSTIDPASAEEAKHPVSQIDVALSEGVTRKLAAGMDVLDPLHTTADITNFENANATPMELTAAFPGGVHNNANTERDFLLKLAVRQSTVAPITGTPARDLRVVRELGNVNWGDVLKPKNPASFAD